jgi:transcriptional regulator GlxA family with amidase domain
MENLLANRKKLQSKFAQILTLTPSQINIESADDVFLKKVAEAVERHMALPAFGLDAFAVAVGMSKMQLYRKLTALTGYGPNEFIRHFRLQRANDLLKANSGNVAQVAYQVGFKNLSYFSKTFREKFDRSPSEVLRGSIIDTDQ